MRVVEAAGLREVVAMGGAPSREHREWRIGLQPCGGRLFTRRNECATHRSAGRTKGGRTSRWREKGTPLRNKNVTLRVAPFATKPAKRALAPRAPRALWRSAQRAPWGARAWLAICQSARRSRAAPW